MVVFSQRQCSYPGQCARQPATEVGKWSIEPLELSVTQAATGLSVTRKTPSMLLDGHAGGFVVHFQQCYNLFCFAGTRS